MRRGIFHLWQDRGAGRLLWVAGAVFLIFVPGEVLAQGCAMCKTALGGADDPLSVGLNTSILFLMAMPFVLVSSVGAWLTYMYRRDRPQRATVYAFRTQKEGGS